MAGCEYEVCCALCSATREPDTLRAVLPIQGYAVQCLYVQFLLTLEHAETPYTAAEKGFTRLTPLTPGSMPSHLSPPHALTIVQCTDTPCFARRSTRTTSTTYLT